MSSSRTIQSSLGISCAGSVIGAGIGALTATISGAAGAAVLTTAGYAEHFVPMSAKIGAAGGALLFGVSGCCGSFFDIKISNFGAPLCIGGVVSYTAAQVVSGMLGYGLMYTAGASEIPFGAVVADMAVGAPVTVIPLTIGLVCCIGIATCCGAGVGAGVSLAVAAADVENNDTIEKALRDTEITIDKNAADQNNADKAAEKNGSSSEEESASSEKDDKKQKNDRMPTIVPADAAVQQVAAVVMPAGQEDVAGPFFAIDINDGAGNHEETAESVIKPAGLKM